MAKTNVTSTQFAAKKLLGKTQTRPKLTDAEEAFPSNVSVPGAGVFAETIPREPGTDYFTMYSASADAPATVERVYFDLVGITDSIYDGGLEDANEGGDSAQGSTTHAYYLKLPSNYQTTSSNPNKGTGNFVNDKRLYLSRGGLQIVPPFTTDAGLPGSSGNNRYFVEIFTGDPTNPSNKISETDAIDWQFDYYSGILFIQDSASVAPVTASAYLYVGKYLDEKLTDISSEAGANIVVKDEGVNKTTNATSFNFVGAAVTATNSGTDVTVTLSSAVFSRTPVTNNITSSVNDRILGVSASSALDIRLPAASGFTDGATFTIKDEAGNANINNITIRTTGGDEIDGESSIVLESSHAAVNIYCDGTSKFFIY